MVAPNTSLRWNGCKLQQGSTANPGLCQQNLTAVNTKHWQLYVARHQCPFIHFQPWQQWHFSVSSHRLWNMEAAPMFVVALPATHSDKVQLSPCQPTLCISNKPVLGLLYEPTFASVSRAPSCFPLSLLSASQATTALGRVEPEAPQSLSLWPAGKRSLTDQNSEAQRKEGRKSHSKFKVK